MSENAYIKGENAQRGPDAITEAATSYLAWLGARNYSPKTVKSRWHSLRKLRAFLAESAIARFQDVRIADLERYRGWMREGGLAENTCEFHLHTVRSLFDHLEKRSLLFENPARRMVLHSPPRKLPRVISVEQVHKLLNAPDCTKPEGLRDRAMLETLYATGARRAELLALTVFDPDLDNRTVRYFGKGRKERVLPLGKHAALHLKRYVQYARPKLLDAEKPPIDALWINRYHRPCLPDTFSLRIRTHAREAGIAEPVTGHTLRRSCVTHMLANGANPLAVAEMLGHADLGTLSHYLRVTIADLKKTHGRSKPGR